MSALTSEGAIERIQPDSPVEVSCGKVRPAAEIDGAGTSLDDPDLYLNRELTWLGFQRRVLNEAADSRTPLLERVKFLAIVSGNLDEFFMKRIGGLKRLIASGHIEPSIDGRTPAEQINDCRGLVREIQGEREAILSIVEQSLAEHNIGVTPWTSLSATDRNQLREDFIRDIFPLVTPLAMDPGHPFPFISNLALNLLVTMRFPGDDEIRMARVKVPIMPGVSPRMLRVGTSTSFVTLEDVMSNNLDLIFPGMKIESCELFRVTRNAIVEVDEEELRAGAIEWYATRGSRSGRVEPRAHDHRQRRRGLSGPQPTSSEGRA